MTRACIGLYPIGERRVQRTAPVSLISQGLDTTGTKGKDCTDHVFTFILLYNFVSVDVFAYNYLMLQTMNDIVDNSGIYSFYRNPSCNLVYTGILYYIFVRRHAEASTMVRHGRHDMRHEYTA